MSADSAQPQCEVIFMGVSKHNLLDVLAPGVCRQSQQQWFGHTAASCPLIAEAASCSLLRLRVTGLSSPEFMAEHQGVFLCEWEDHEGGSS